MNFLLKQKTGFPKSCLFFFIPDYSLVNLKGKSNLEEIYHGPESQGRH